MEAEYVSLSEASKDAVFLRNLLSDLVGFTGAVDIYCDNQSAIKTVNNPVFHNRTKHIDIRYHYVRQLVKEKLE